MPLKKILILKIIMEQIKTKQTELATKLYGTNLNVEGSFIETNRIIYCGVMPTTYVHMYTA